MVRRMDWKLLATTFVAVFLAEIGDKTQLATMSFATGSTSRWAVFIGSALALVTASAIAVLAGEALTRVVPPVWLRRGAGAAFVVIGILFLFTGGDAAPTDGEHQEDGEHQDGGAEEARP